MIHNRRTKIGWRSQQLCDNIKPIKITRLGVLFGAALIAFVNKIHCSPSQPTSVSFMNETHDSITRSAFDSALDKASDTSRAHEVDRTERRQFNLTTWNHKTSGGLKDLDRLKLAAIYRNASSVFEWGLGESSYIAAEVDVPRYGGVDSDAAWVSAARDKSPQHFRFHLGDIGPTGVWGRPAGGHQPKAYINYQFTPLSTEKAFEVYMVDGRMRTACALVAFLHASARGETEEEKSPIVLVHDYYDNHHSKDCHECRNFRWQLPFHRVTEVADLVDHSGAMLAVFKRKAGVTDNDIKALWEEVGLHET
mmetsp:Transcript_22934/g.39242  ORF Transcript_22934/g.39242 Transcript_22934/m.39242 type:complete len:308 (-) Transcript_22934:31-954(-)|eukprot:CAMPEP_0183763104 /NCGR_PEP_ID=MMETSP0739-20130205/9474_1 /TAXON_ID=385413 /ORGANISM="Thalassiosira miniscula, Strain CCMP1093" /LENGTH=307 /DNA_ID=CAMNT_0026001461 /DNA_START=370 /DNA_END=1293 /DNA_ORIENTATION=-